MNDLTTDQIIQLRIAALEAGSLLAAHYPRWGRPIDLADECFDWLTRGEFRFSTSPTPVDQP